MWSIAYSDRLLSWCSLRDNVQDLPLEQALNEINQWWFEAPWHPYGLHWDDRKTWPTPWELLEDTALCPVARGLGIMYTLALIQRQDMTGAVMTVTDTGETVVKLGSYTLNWDRNTLVNSSPVVSRTRLSLQEVFDRLH